MITKYQKSSRLWNPWREGACRSSPQLPNGDCELRAQCLSSCHLMARLMSFSRCRNTTGLKDKSLLIACSFRCLCFWMYDHSPYVCVFWEAALNLNQCCQPFPEPHGQAFTFSENTKHRPHTSGRRRTFREQCKVPPHSGSSPTTGGFCSGHGCAAKSQDFWHSSSPLAAGWPCAICEQRVDSLGCTANRWKEGLTNRTLYAICLTAGVT